mgnify:CR=1 FL=1
MKKFNSEKELREFISNNFTYNELFVSILYYNNYNFYDIVDKDYDYLLDLLIDITNLFGDDIIRVLLENSNRDDLSDELLDYLFSDNKKV